ncbi:MAG: hypothetical protein R3228_09090 [Halioglobus sp.]|nr:hypothetical protein [Halioglobus sp.]
MLSVVKKTLLYLLLGFLALVAAFDIWGRLTLGTITPQENAARDLRANEVVMVFGASGSVGDGLLKAALEDPQVSKVHVVTRSLTPRIEQGAASGALELHMHKDFENYDSLREELATVNTVLWALGTSSLLVDDETYTWIHVDFPVAFVRTWLEERRQAPMAFHNVTGMGTDPEGSQKWAREKGRAERELAAMAEGTGLRTFSYRSAYIRPTSEQSNALHYLGELLLRPGYLVIPGIELGRAMLEISARTEELPNGTLLDNADSIFYAELYAPE